MNTTTSRDTRLLLYRRFLTLTDKTPVAVVAVDKKAPLALLLLLLESSEMLDQQQGRKVER